MNYRHAFHAGNFADVMKHALLARIIAHLRRKPTPFRVIDTHAGIGVYDLNSPEAGRTGEWHDGVARLDASLSQPVEELLAPYRAALASARERHGAAAYPGSPLLAALLSRRIDRVVAVEAHPADGDALAGTFAGERRVKVLRLDGLMALRSLIPPPERRGLVLIDPPYEQPGELERAGEALVTAVRRWPTGIFALWYPIKGVDGPRRLARLMSEGGIRALRLELLVSPPSEAGPLAGSGLLVANPPWRLDEDAAVLLAGLARRLARPGWPGQWMCETVGPSTKRPPPQA